MRGSRPRRYVAELFGRHRGEAIWIVGSDPSLSEYPDDFLEGKVGITLHLAHRKFPGATWRYSSEYDRSEHLAATDPDYMRQPLIAAMPLYGKSGRETEGLFAAFGEVYYHRMWNYPPSGVRGAVSDSFTGWKVRKTMEGRASVWGSHGTCLHTALYVAVLMGAKEIHLIGAGHGMYKPGLEHFDAVAGEDKSMRPTYPSFDDPVNTVPVIEQTLALKQACLDAGIAFKWYRTWTPNMDELIEVDAAWLAGRKALTKRRFGIARRIYRAALKRPVYEIVSRL